MLQLLGSGTISMLLMFKHGWLWSMNQWKMGQICHLSCIFLCLVSSILFLCKERTFEILHTGEQCPLLFLGELCRRGEIVREEVCCRAKASCSVFPHGFGQLLHLEQVSVVKTQQEKQQQLSSPVLVSRQPPTPHYIWMPPSHFHFKHGRVSISFAL